MTGFGSGEAALGRGRLIVELRSLNHRFLDVRVRIPPELAEHAFFVEHAVRGCLSRGRFEVNVRIEGPALPFPRLSLERARGLYQALASLRDELAPGTELPVSSILSAPNLLAQPEPAETDALRDALERALRSAVERLEAMRECEGEALRKELSERLEHARSLRIRVSKQSAGTVDGVRARMRERLQRLLDDVNVQVDSGRLEIELALLAERTDISEELTRLSSHFDQFASLLVAGDAVGRRLDFLLQEVGRETNTIGAKCQDATLSHLVVELKSEIERMREQVQNVE
jgi:uncharacterized protein (TIGR00255 family)